MTETFWQPAEYAFPGERLDEFLLWAAERGASDVALQTGSPAFVEVDGRLERATRASVGRTEMELLVEALFNETGVGVLRSGKAIDCSKTVQQGRLRRRRFRVNISPAEVDHSFAVSIALRVMPDEVPSLDGLGIEAGIVEAWELCAGLTLVTGVPGSGKSTLLAAGTRRLLEKGAGRIQSFEAPIEYVFDGIAGDAAMMSSAEVPRHFATFADGLRSSLRRRCPGGRTGPAADTLPHRHRHRARCRRQSRAQHRRPRPRQASPATRRSNRFQAARNYPCLHAPLCETPWVGDRGRVAASC